MSSDTTNEMNPFESGQVYEPLPHEHGPGRKDGRVDFDTNDGETVASVVAYPSLIDTGVDVVEIDAPLTRPLRIYVNDGRVVTLNTDGSIRTEEDKD